MKGKALVLALLLACTPGAWTPASVAQTPGGGDAEVQRFDGEKFWDYLGCAAAVAFAAGSQAWYVPAIACTRAIQKHWVD